MTLAENGSHQKHAKLKKPELGHFGRHELAILGTPCGHIKRLTEYLVTSLTDCGPIGFVDADHKAAALDAPQALTFTDKINFRRFDYLGSFNAFQLKPYFDQCELVLVNGNHFKANAQIVIIDSKKPLERKLDRLTNPILVVKKEPDEIIPDYLESYLVDLPVLEWEDQQGIADIVSRWYKARIPSLKGLVLAGGKSVRMKQDKGAIEYHGVTQRRYVHDQLQSLDVPSLISCRPEQATDMNDDLPVLPDTVQGLGPMGALLSAFREDPDSAWLAIACDLPFLTIGTIEYLISNRDHSKMATTFQSPFDEFPEPLITIWEPRSYPILLNFLSQGYSCPRKALINSDVSILQAPNPKDLSNINHPEEYEATVADLRSKI